MGFLVKSLESRGYKVHVRKGERIDAYDPVTNEFICGFTWNKGTSAAPGRWTFDFTMADVFSLRDLKTVLTEAGRVTRLRKHALSAWDQFLETKSDKRWASYLGIVAALFAGRPAAAKEDTDG